MDETAAVQNVFDQIADAYDSVDVSFFRPIASGLVEALAVGRGERALDIGCGRGAVLSALAAAVGSSGSVTGIDVSPRMVELTAADFEASDVPVDVRVGDAMAPEVPPASFDVIASSLVLFFLPDPAMALRAWHPLLRADGRLGVSTFGPYSQKWREEVDAALESFIPPDVADARVTGRQGPFSSDEGMETLVRSAGYRAVRTVTATVSPRFDDPEHWYRWSTSVGQRRMWDRIPEDRLAEVQAAVFAAVDRCRDDEGRIGFDQEVRYTLASA